MKLSFSFYNLVLLSVFEVDCGNLLEKANKPALSYNLFEAFPGNVKNFLGWLLPTHQDDIKEKKKKSFTLNLVEKKFPKKELVPATLLVDQDFALQGNLRMGRGVETLGDYIHLRSGSRAARKYYGYFDSAVEKYAESFKQVDKIMEEFNADGSVIDSQSFEILG